MMLFQKSVSLAIAYSGIVFVKVLTLGVISSTSAFSQIVPDETLPLPSQVTVEDSLYKIEGGTAAGSNLFHSFEEFSIPTGAEAFFNNATRIENILTRVTGSNISNIDGSIRANGTANLFLLNPNGLIFGPNARLDIGGSFFGTTANSIVFENGEQFSAMAPEVQPLLNVSVPVGLQWGGQTGEIRVRGGGHGFTTTNPIFAPIVREDNGLGLQVNPGHTLALVGSDVRLDGATLTAEGGHIELGGVEEGFVGLTAPSSPGSNQWHLNYDGVSGFQDVRLVRQAAADVSGIGVGSLQIVGEQIALSDGSIALLQNEGPQTFGELRVRASESLTLIGTTPDGLLPSGLRQATVGVGNTGDMEVSTPQLAIREGGQILNQASAEGNAGDINLQATNSIEITGASLRNPLALSLISNVSNNLGSGGDVMVSTQDLSIRGGGLLTATTFGAGSAGNVVVNATGTIEVVGVEPRIISPSLIGSGTNSTGNAGSTTVNASRTIVRDGGRIASFTVASGNSGRVLLNATELVEVSGTVPGSINPSLIDASANRVDEVTQRAFGIPPIPSGSPGNLEINTPRLNVIDGAQVTVRNDGTGSAGNLQVNAEAILLDEEGGITASTLSGEGGNIQLSLDNSLQLRNGSSISAEAGGTGNGGNIAIDAEAIALLENSTITANAFEGNGGSIQIATQGIFLSPDSSITASSQLGIDGVVAVTQPEIDTSSAFVQLSSNPIDSETQVTSACEAVAENTFVVTGNGGLPPDPTDVLRSQTVWTDTRLTEIQASPPEVDSEGRSPSTELDSLQLQLVEATEEQRQDDRTMALVSTRSPSETPTDASDSELVEATQWRIDADGTVELISDRSSRQAPFSTLPCLSAR
ncbi:filamentous hemagglutinin N-terminal domain-containing protein [Geitlerinema sp. CS-897]|nr:filamentous hemagglutinin N-terminal domain-containing protein [Geitlerinema sp. CS-897]